MTQIITDIKVQRPRLNIDSLYFIDSYDSEIETLMQKQELYREFMEIQIENELLVNEEVRKF